MQMRTRSITSLLLALAITGGLLFVLPYLNAWNAALPLTIAHVALGAALAPALAIFLWRHARGYQRWVIAGRGAWWLLVGVMGIAASGSALILVGQRGRIAALHGLAGLALAFWFARHAGLARLRRGGGNVFWAACCALLALLVAWAVPIGFPQDAASPTVTSFTPADMRAAGAIPPYNAATMAPERCALCHADIVEQWRQSMHAVADTELVYARVVGEFRLRYGVEASNWCAGCHSSLRLARNEMNIKVADVAQPNIDCMACHSIREVHTPIGDNRFTLEIKPEADYSLDAGLADRLLLMQPAAHRARWNASVVRSAEFCGACHRQSLPAFLAGDGKELVLQDTYTEWRESRYNSSDPSVRRTCQSCHMPSAPGIAPDLGDNRPSHFFTGGSRDIARIIGARAIYADQQRLLESAATLSVAGACAQQGGAILVQITNSGTGHHLPTGVTDLRQVWLEVIATDNAGGVVYHSGAVDERGRLDSAAVRFGVILGDEQGQPVYLHNIARARRILQDTTLPAGEMREIRYALPPRSPTPLHVEVKLWYQSVPQDFIDHFITPEVRFERVMMARASTVLTLPATCGQ